MSLEYLIRGMCGTYNTGKKKIVVELGRASVPYDCPKCGKNASVYDTKARTWRHTNLMNCRIELIADVPRVECSTCGMNTIVVPPGIS